MKLDKERLGHWKISLIDLRKTNRDVGRRQQRHKFRFEWTFCSSLSVSSSLR